MASINLGNGNHDLGGEYRLENDGGQWFIMGKNLSAPCDSFEQAQQLLDMLKGKDVFERTEPKHE